MRLKLKRLLLTEWGSSIGNGWDDILGEINPHPVYCTLELSRHNLSSLLIPTLDVSQ